jgi:hypothetical protein
MSGLNPLKRQQTVHELDQERFSDIYRQIHMASAWWLDGHNERETWAGRAVARLEELVPYDGHERKATWTMYLSHAVYLTAQSLCHGDTWHESGSIWAADETRAITMRAKNRRSLTSILGAVLYALMDYP